MNRTLPLTEIEPALVLSRFKPRPDVLKIAKEKETAFELLNQLVVDQDFNAAFDVLAHSMVPQAVVWWGCLCLWDLHRDHPEDPVFDEAMRRIISWLQKPNEKKRQAVGEVEQQFGQTSPMRILINAVLASHGSMAPAGLPEVKAPKFLYAVMGSGAIKLIAAQSPPDNYSSTCKQILRHGMEVLQGANLWEKNPVPDARP